MVLICDLKAAISLSFRSRSLINCENCTRPVMRDHMKKTILDDINHGFIINSPSRLAGNP